MAGDRAAAVHRRAARPRPLHHARHARRSCRPGPISSRVRPRGGRRLADRRWWGFGQDDRPAHGGAGGGRRCHAGRSRPLRDRLCFAVARPAARTAALRRRGDRRRPRVDHPGDRRAHRRARPAPSVAVRPRRAGRDPVGVSRQGPLVAAHRRHRRRLPEPQCDPRHGPADGDRTARLARRVPSSGHRWSSARHPHRPCCRSPAGGTGVVDVVDRLAPRAPSDRRAGLRRLRDPDGAEQGSRAAGWPRAVEQRARASRCRQRRSIGVRAGGRDRRVRQGCGWAPTARADDDGSAGSGPRAAGRQPADPRDAGTDRCVRRDRRGRRHLHRIVRRRPAALGAHDRLTSSRPVARRQWARGVVDWSRWRARRSRPARHGQGRRRGRAARGLRGALRVAAARAAVRARRRQPRPLRQR